MAIISSGVDVEEPPEGYYAFVASPNAEPPKVRPPPYSQMEVDCIDIEMKSPYATSHNLCGDLNKGTIPRNPMGQNVLGSRYPFELIRNHTLRFLSRTLPILKSDDTLPKVAQLQAVNPLEHNNINSYNGERGDRVKRDLSDVEIEDEKPKSDEPSRNARKFCDQGGVLCMLYRVINGESYNSAPTTTVHLAAERRDEPAPAPTVPRYEGPPTPCPAKVEYATPVFAKNYQGVWRYVVQIPYEGYFTQTVEVTRCLQSRCHYLDGGCLSSPRWSSMLVAEIYYPDTVLSAAETNGQPQRNPVTATTPPPVQDFQAYQQYLHKRAGLQAGVQSSSTSRPTHCDGVDSLGCFQVRLYYDWFLIPGSCKCWRPDYFNRYVRRRNGDL
ncbi:uncharacterized protein LOC123297783 [Chrysoperla carnea]|uniref:uncharacterized protein LOC123297783 n=1 Tax=Chrysoperla carnea TaxID=189513 RepID=UPI001D07FA7B|nr:uncharacterized protein LOC123297783 [Chrysoperla carnea]